MLLKSTNSFIIFASASINVHQWLLAFRWKKVIQIFPINSIVTIPHGSAVTWTLNLINTRLPFLSHNFVQRQYFKYSKYRANFCQISKDENPIVHFLMIGRKMFHTLNDAFRYLKINYSITLKIDLHIGFYCEYLIKNGFNCHPFIRKFTGWSRLVHICFVYITCQTKIRNFQSSIIHHQNVSCGQIPVNEFLLR